METITKMESTKINGLMHNCRFEDRQLEILNKNFERLNKISETKEEWMKDYIDRTMPIRSHFWILLSSLSILAGFAALMQYINKF